MWSLSGILLVNYSNISQMGQKKEGRQDIHGTCPPVCACSAELMCARQTGSPHCGPVLWLIRTHQIQLGSFWLLTENTEFSQHGIWQADNLWTPDTMGWKLTWIWIFLNTTRVFFSNWSFPLPYFYSVASAVPILRPKFNLRGPRPASVGFLQYCQEVVSPALRAAANTDLE